MHRRYRTFLMILVVVAAVVIETAAHGEQRASRISTRGNAMTFRATKKTVDPATSNSRSDAVVGGKRPKPVNSKIAQRIAQQRDHLKSDRLSDEERRLIEEQIERDTKKLEEEQRTRKKQGDPYVDSRIREAHRRPHHHVDIPLPEVDAPEPIVDLATYNTTSLDVFFGMAPHFVVLLVTEASCEQCGDATRVFAEVCSSFAEEEFPLLREQRMMRFAVLNATENPLRYDEILRKFPFDRTPMHQKPSTLLLHPRSHWSYDSMPHFVTFRNSATYTADLTHALRRILHMPQSRFRNEDELMRCAFETSNDGVAIIFFRDFRAVPQAAKLLDRALHGTQHHVPVCRLLQRPVEEKNAQKENLNTADDVSALLSTYNPNGADIAAFFVDERNPDEFLAEYFLLDSNITQTATPLSRTARVLETLRLRRWVESVLARRHTRSGRRFHNIHGRHQWQTRGSSNCLRRAESGDTVQASIRATSVDSGYIFAELPLQWYVVNSTIPGLPPYLHQDIFLGRCPGTHEIFSPRKEGFHDELVEINITEIRAPPPPISVPVENPQPDEEPNADL